jgi:hypothetical protein
MPQIVKVFRINPLDWWAGYDFASVKSAYRVATGSAMEEGIDEEEGLPQDAMRTLRIYPNAYAKESRSFQEELVRMVADGKGFPRYFAGRYTHQKRNYSIRHENN